MMLYTNYYTRAMLEDAGKSAHRPAALRRQNDAAVRHTSPANEQQVFASRYQLYLPAEDGILRETQARQEQLEKLLEKASRP